MNLSTNPALTVVVSLPLAAVSRVVTVVSDDERAMPDDTLRESVIPVGGFVSEDYLAEIITDLLFDIYLVDGDPRVIA